MRKTTDRDLARTALEKHAGIKGVSVDHGDVAVARLARRTGLREGMVEVLRWVMETGTVLDLYLGQTAHHKVDQGTGPDISLS